MRDKRLIYIGIIVIALIGLVIFILIRKPAPDLQVGENVDLEVGADSVVVIIEQTADLTQINDLKARVQNSYPDKTIEVQVAYPYSEENNETLKTRIENPEETPDSEPNEGSDPGIPDGG